MKLTSNLIICSNSIAIKIRSSLLEKKQRTQNKIISFSFLFSYAFCIMQS